MATFGAGGNSSGSALQTVRKRFGKASALQRSYNEAATKNHCSKNTSSACKPAASRSSFVSVSLTEQESQIKNCFSRIFKYFLLESPRTSGPEALRVARCEILNYHSELKLQIATPNSESLNQQVRMASFPIRNFRFKTSESKLQNENWQYLNASRSFETASRANFY